MTPSDRVASLNLSIALCKRGKGCAFLLARASPCALAHSVWSEGRSRKMVGKLDAGLHPASATTAPQPH